MLMTVVWSVVASYFISSALSSVIVYVTIALTLPGKFISPSLEFIVSFNVLSLTSSAS